MSPRKHWLGVFMIMGMLAFGGWTLAWPGYRQSATINRQIDALKLKVAGLSDQTGIARSLAEKLFRAQTRIEHQLKSIPNSPEVAELIRKLSLPVDQTRVADQTFTAGSPSDAIVGMKSPMRVMPLTVEMEAAFDSVFALMRNAESLNRLVRITSVTISCKRDEKKPDSSMVKATVGLDAIFEPPGGEEAY